VYTATSFCISDTTSETPAMALAAATNSSRAATVVNTNLAFAGAPLSSGVQVARRPPRAARALRTGVLPAGKSTLEITSVTSMVTCGTSRLDYSCWEAVQEVFRVSGYIPSLLVTVSSKACGKLRT